MTFGEIWVIGSAIVWGLTIIVAAVVYAVVPPRPNKGEDVMMPIFFIGGIGGMLWHVVVVLAVAGGVVAGVFFGVVWLTRKVMNALDGGVSTATPGLIPTRWKRLFRRS